MSSLEYLLHRSSGVMPRRHLEAAGVSETDLRALIRRGLLRRVRHGWYASPTADPLILRAVRAGGVLTCLDALHRHGVWVPEHPDALHVRPESRGGHVTAGHVCRTFGTIARATSAVDDLITSLQYAARCLDAEGFVVVCDSALNLGLITVDELTAAFARAPRCVRELLGRCDRRAQSGTETMVRLRLRSKNIGVVIQHPVDGVGIVDLLVGDRLVIEVDGKAHHTGVERYESDRSRDRDLIRLGYLPMRLSYRQVVHDWTDCEQTIIDLVRRGEHRRRLRDRR